jgi:hypothetical protein
VLAREDTRGLLRGAAVALVFLAVIPLGMLNAPYSDPSGDADFFPLLPVLAGLIYGPVFPFYFSNHPSLAFRLGLTGAQLLLLVAAFGWFARQVRLREQVLYAMLTVGALAILTPFLLKALS